MGIARRSLLKGAIAASALMPLSGFTSTAYAQPAGQKILIKGGYVASLDRNIGELKTGDVVIDGDLEPFIKAYLLWARGRDA